MTTQIGTIPLPMRIQLYDGEHFDTVADTDLEIPVDGHTEGAAIVPSLADGSVHQELARTLRKIADTLDELAKETP